MDGMTFEEPSMPSIPGIDGSIVAVGVGFAICDDSMVDPSAIVMVPAVAGAGLGICDDGIVVPSSMLMLPAVVGFAFGICADCMVVPSAIFMEPDPFGLLSAATAGPANASAQPAVAARPCQSRLFMCASQVDIAMAIVRDEPDASWRDGTRFDEGSIKPACVPSKTWLPTRCLIRAAHAMYGLTRMRRGLAREGPASAMARVAPSVGRTGLDPAVLIDSSSNRAD